MTNKRTSTVHSRSWRIAKKQNASRSFFERAIRFAFRLSNRITSSLLRSSYVLGCWALLFALCFTLTQSRENNRLEKVLQSGSLQVVSRNGPTTYFEDASGSTGFEFQLARRFAKHLGVKLDIKSASSIDRLLDDIHAEEFDIAAAGLVMSDLKRSQFQVSAPYLTTASTLLYRSGSRTPKEVTDMVGRKLVVVKGSAHADKLAGLKSYYPGLAWEERSDVDVLDLMEMVHEGAIDYALVSANGYRMNASLYPKARPARLLSEQKTLNWLLPPGKDNSLAHEVDNFLALEKTQRYIQRLEENYYGHAGQIGYSGALVFKERLDSRLPKYSIAIKTAADRYGIDWELLAALSYQESHWNPKAKSYTGVRGFMMLTRTTAKQVGVDNRLDAEQSIDGGAQYFKSLYSRLPSRITEPDRTYLALAAYNVGMGHLEDARVLTESAGQDPDYWQDIKPHLLSLSKKSVYRNTKHGYARGWEAVDYVENIRHFQNVIVWNEMTKRREERLAREAQQADILGVELPVDRPRGLDILAL